MRKASRIIAIGLLVSQPIFAQTDQVVAVDIHTGPIAPSDTIENIDIDAGWTFGATIAYYFLDRKLGIYTGFDLDVFEADSLSGPETSAAILHGYSLGVEYRGEIPNGKFGYFARGGAHVSKLRLLDDDDEVSETKHDTGFETSAGFTYDIGSDWALRGGIRYKTFSRRFKNSAGSDNAELDSTALLLGARYNF